MRKIVMMLLLPLFPLSNRQFGAVVLQRLTHQPDTDTSTSTSGGGSHSGISNTIHHGAESVFVFTEEKTTRQQKEENDIVMFKGQKTIVMLHICSAAFNLLPDIMNEAVDPLTIDLNRVRHHCSTVINCSTLGVFLKNLFFIFLQQPEWRPRFRKRCFIIVPLNY